ncbi:CsgG/HfaB family protein [Treponema sp. R80B11-R83G3]
MKKFLLILVYFVLTAEAVSAQQLELKEVITRSARGIEGEVPQKAKIALLNFESPAKGFSDYALDELTSELLEAGKVTVVDRKNITAILNEMKFQYSGYVSDESMVSIGKMIGAQYIISGALTDMETYYRFRIRIINVETAAIQRQITSELKKDRQVVFLLSGSSSAEEFERSIPTANVKDNWLSGEFSGGYNLWQGASLNVGLRYERMINSKISTGVNLFLGIPLEPVTYDGYLPSSGYGSSSSDKAQLEDFDRGTVFGIDAFLRFYPWGRKFFMGLALGYFNAGNQVLDEYDIPPQPGQDYIWYLSVMGSGLSITGEFGWKIDIGKPGGLFLGFGFLGTFIIGEMTNFYMNIPVPSWAHGAENDVNRHKNDPVYADGNWRGYLNLGWAF